MNAAMVRALFLDAVYQVLDNRVFRILTLCVLFMVGVTFAIGFRENEVVLFFGWRRYDYEELFAVFDLMVQAGIDPRLQAIRFVQSLFVDEVAGSLGMAFALAATAFFVPRMLERGLADGLLSKPIGRAAFYLTRFVAGLLFVGLLALLLVGGVHLGFALNSHYSDPGFLWAWVTLVYVFALLHGVSMLIGVWTRSTVASILLALVFFLLTSVAHNIWIIKEWKSAEGIEGAPNTAAGTGQSDELVWLTNVLVGTLNAVHYTLPKTTDADVLTEQLRAAVERSAALVSDDETFFAVQGLPPGFVRAEPPDRERLYLPLAGRSDAECLLAATWRADPDAARVWIERSLRSDDELRSLRDRAEALQTALLRDQPGLQVKVRFAEVREHPARALEIDDGRGEPKRWSLVTIFNAPGPDRTAAFALVVETREGWSHEPQDPDETPPSADGSPLDPFAASRVAYDLSGDFEAQFVLDTRSRDDGPPFRRWYADQFRWDAPLRYNALFSIGSSLAFTLAVLGLGVWKLRRIDF